MTKNKCICIKNNSGLGVEFLCNHFYFYRKETDDDINFEVGDHWKTFYWHFVFINDTDYLAFEEDDFNEYFMDIIKYREEKLNTILK